MHLTEKEKEVEEVRILLFCMRTCNFILTITLETVSSIFIFICETNVPKLNSSTAAVLFLSLNHLSGSSF